ncbi:MAG: hypothetical protein LBI78_05725 [Campylobacteraceae bacterium]|jgi:hypothetical protein|nr:hypothetical protein [Campylobacteraceae bacterium]
MIDEELSLAVVRYYGVGVEFYPHSDKTRVIDEFGEEKGMVLLYKIDKILNELDGLLRDCSNYTLNGVTDWAIDMMKKKHPELNEQALKALGWAFSFAWWK